MQPNIVLYGEEHPDGENIGRCIDADMKSRPDLLIIAGTSLKVIGIKRLVRNAAKVVHERGGIVVYINRTLPAASSWKGLIDYHIDSDCDEWVEDLRRRQPGLFLKQTEIPITPSKTGKVIENLKGVKSKVEINSIALSGALDMCQVVAPSSAIECSSKLKRKYKADADPLHDITNMLEPSSMTTPEKKLKFKKAVKSVFGLPPKKANAKPKIATLEKLAILKDRAESADTSLLTISVYGR